jgi:hypothetical protein
MPSKQTACDFGSPDFKSGGFGSADLVSADIGNRLRVARGSNPTLDWRKPALALVASNLLEMTRLRSSELELGSTHDAPARIAVAPEQWRSFLENFSRQHRGWLVTLESSPQDRSPLALPSDWRLQEVVAPPNAPRGELCIAMSREGEDFLRCLSSAVRLTLLRDASGADSGLEIASADGSVLTLHFRAAAKPETLDGVLPDNVQRRR